MCFGSIAQNTSRPHGPRVVHHWQRVRARPSCMSMSAVWNCARCCRMLAAEVEWRDTPQGEANQQRRVSSVLWTGSVRGGVGAR